MTARHKLNRAAVYTTLILATIAGVLTGSLLVFLIVLGIVLVVAVHNGDIRLQ